MSERLMELGKTACLGAMGHYLAKIIRDGVVIDEFDCDNLITNQGLDHIAGVIFTGVPPVPQWFLGLFANNYQPVPTDTAASISANAGESSAYAGNQRLPFNAVEAQQQATNAANVATFTFTAAVTIYGAFLISSAPQGSGQGVLMSAAQFATSKTLANGDQLVLTYVFAVAST